MSNIEEELKEFDQKRKNELYEFRKIIISKQMNLIREVKELEKTIGIKNEEIPNIGITFNNKIVEISQKFQQSDLSMFASTIMNYGESRGKIVTHSFVGQTILGSLISISDEGIKKLEQYNNKLIEVIKEKYKPLQYNKKFKFVAKIIITIKLLTGKIKIEQFSLTEEERKELENMLSEYKKINLRLWNYDLKENIVDSIMKSLKGIEYSDLTILRIEDECIIPNFEKLGFTDLIPEIEDKIEEYMRANQKPWKLTPEEKKETKEDIQLETTNDNGKSNNQETNQGR